MPHLSTPLAAPDMGSSNVEICVDGKPIVTLVPASGRVRVGLAMPALRRVVDVSIQPGAPCGALNEAGHRARVRSTSVEAATREALSEAARRSDAWAPPNDASLVAAFGGIAFPLLGVIYNDGATPLREVPRWAETVLAARTARDGARVAFGSKATRPVVRALVRALRPGAGRPVDLTSLALGLAGVAVLDPDRLARVLAEDRPGPVAVDLPDPSSLAEASDRLCRWGPLRSERVLRDAARDPDGLRMLLETVRYARDLGSQGPRRLPNRLAEMHDVHRIRFVTAPPPRPVAGSGRPAGPVRRVAAPRHAVPSRAPQLNNRDDRAAPVRRAVPAADRADAVQGPVHRIYAPPAGLSQVSPHTPLPVSDAVRRLENTMTADLVFVVPRTAGDLARWSRVLSNCLGDYGPAVAAGRSIIIGVQRGGVLRYAIEITPAAVIRQFVGPANRRPEDYVRRRVVAALAGAGLLDRMARNNAVWFAGLDL